MCCLAVPWRLWRSRQLAPVKPNRQLFAVAQGHAAHMAKQERLEDPDGPRSSKRLEDAGYRFHSVQCLLAQWGGLKPDPVVNSWIESKDTRDIITDDWKDIGIGIVRNQSGVAYFAVVLAAPE